MVSLVSVIGLLVILLINTLFAAVATRFLRIRLETHWGTLLYVLVLIPMVLFVFTLVLSGPLGLGADLGSTEMVFTVVIGIPLALGYTIDVFWMPHPDDVELPETTEN
ncbi:hypothetical protein [Natrononativus amylolyticus]|uniref:hypothetical protein n=1 Tax=Natrononativus amylolyticus TaxID=2963434 RepID=UPI0020CE97A6|nr:hypothetical protein [Natrononativus amylolyticus]